MNKRKRKKNSINKLINKYSNLMMWIAGVCVILALVIRDVGKARGLAPGAMEHAGHVAPGVLPTGFTAWSTVILFLAATVLAGFPILHRAIQGLKFKTVGIELLVTIAVVGALIIGEYSEAAIVTFLFQFGAFLEQKTMKKTRSAIKALTEMAPATAFRIEDGQPVEIDADEVEEGDLLLVKTGGKVPVDGIIASGEGHINESSITGESVPRHKVCGDFVYAGTIVDSGSFQMEATRVGEDTTFAKIIELVEEAQDAKSPMERFIDKFAKYYTPFVVLLALLVYIFVRDLDTAITVLVLACPGALVIGAPIANVAGIGSGATMGVLLKGGDSVYTFVKTDTVVFDKTGTLTVGYPKVTGVYGYGEVDDTGEAGATGMSDGVGEVGLYRAIAVAAACECAGDHPLARAVIEYYDGICQSEGICSSEKANSYDLEVDLDDVKILKGLGLEAEVIERSAQKINVLVGSLRLMNERNVEIPDKALQDISNEHENCATTVLIAIDGKLEALLGISDAVREDARESMSQLKALGIKKLVMLTGDNLSTAQAVAKSIGIDEVHAELLPEDKLKKIKEMQETATVTFVGDGVNDSPALTMADTGIAMGGGTDIAIESSDVVLIKSRLSNISGALKLAKKTVSIMYQNIAIAVGTVILLLMGLFAGYIHMAIGMLIHEASILVVILNAMRLLIRRKER